MSCTNVGTLKFMSPERCVYVCVYTTATTTKMTTTTNITPDDCTYAYYYVGAFIQLGCMEIRTMSHRMYGAWGW